MKTLETIDPANLADVTGGRALTRHGGISPMLAQYSLLSPLASPLVNPLVNPLLANNNNNGLMTAMCCAVMMRNMRA